MPDFTKRVVKGASADLEAGEPIITALAAQPPGSLTRGVAGVRFGVSEVPVIKYWMWVHLDSNQGPAGYEPDALTAELWTQSPITGPGSIAVSRSQARPLSSRA